MGGLIDVKIRRFNNSGLKTREKNALKNFRNEIQIRNWPVIGGH